MTTAKKMDKKSNPLTNRNKVKDLKHSDLLNLVTKNEMSNLKLKRIYLIDDDLEFVNIFKEKILPKSKYELFTFNDGFSALKSMAKIPPNLIILDIMLPLLDGIKMGGIIKDISLFNIPIIYTSSDQKNFKKLVEFSDVKNINFLTKPFTTNALKESISSAISSREK